MPDEKQTKALISLDRLIKAIYLKWLHELDNCSMVTLTVPKLRGIFSQMKNDMEAIDDIEDFIYKDGEQE